MEQVENNQSNAFSNSVGMKVEDLKEAVKIDCFTRITMYIKNLINCFCESSCHKNK